MTEKTVLTDDELDKVNGGITSTEAANQNNIGRACTVLMESGDDGDNMVPKDGIYKGGLNGSFADVEVNGQIIRFSLNNISFK